MTTTDVHITLMGKGGIGKSFAAYVLAQYERSKGRDPACIDLDPTNATFSSFKALAVRRLEIMDGEEINTRRFDQLVELIATAKSDVVIDTGSTSFIPLSHYLLSNEVPNALKGLGRQLVVHAVITGGQDLLDTLHGFSQMADQFPTETRFIVWLNAHHGPVQSEGKGFEEMETFKKYKKRISGIVRIPQLKTETYGVDLRNMLESRLTFEEALKGPSQTIMTRQRLKLIQDKLYEQLTAAGL
jgi:hypothetical protein